MRRITCLTKSVFVPLMIVGIALGSAEAGSRYARRTARCVCPSTGNCLPESCAPATATLPPVAPQSESPVSAAERAASAASNEFAFDFYRRLSHAEGNRFFSPISLSIGLAMLSRGASGDTQREILGVAHFDRAPQEVSGGLAELRNRLVSGGKGDQVRLANRLWIEKGFPLDRGFRQSLRDDFGAEPGEVNFKDLAGARDTINRWGSEITAGRIQELLSLQSLNDDTRFVLTGGIHFKGTWKFQFDPAATTDAPFHVTPGRDVTARMMQLTGALNYAETDELQILELPYTGSSLAMIVLLPGKLDGISGLEASLSADQVSKWIAGAHEEGEVEVHLPRFTFSTEAPLKQELVALGMTRAFSDEAEFPAIATDRGQKLNDAVQQAFVAVNEEGAEAAAVFGFIGGNLPGPVPRHILFNADHPFVFLIHDTRSGVILFLGRVVEPSQ